ncbi:MAG: ISL3 family transposase [Planctomycetaceae bacterium]
MLLKTILNRVAPQKSFIYGKVTLASDGGRLALEVDIKPRRNSLPICSGCHRKRPGYDRLPVRRFEFVPLWQIAVSFVYTMRRVDCPKCGVVVEEVPWGDGKNHLTVAYRWFLAGWAKRLSWREVAEVFHASWDSVHRVVGFAVEWGLQRRTLSGIKALGIDEVQWQRGHHYLTLVYQIDVGPRRLLWVCLDRTEESLRGFFRTLGDEAKASIRYLCSDMWKPYLNVLAQEISTAIHVLDRFHIMQAMNKAIAEVRAEEARRLKRDGYEPVLKHARWCLLKRRENLTRKQTVKLAELVKYNWRSVRSNLLREDFQRFWTYQYPGWARRFLREWCTRTMRSKIEPMKKVARMLRGHEELILNWFKARGTISAGVTEGLNNKLKLTTRKAYGFRTFDAVHTALYHNLGSLPEPEFTHKFC